LPNLTGSNQPSVRFGNLTYEPRMTSSHPNSEPPRRPTTAQVLLGLFVVGQLFFLFAANLLGLLESARPKLKDRPLVEKLLPGWSEKEGHSYDAFQVVTGLTSRWAQLTGQPQDWSLFAPNVTDRIPFLAVELRWDDGRVELLPSENEPADLNGFLRIGKFRLRRYEACLDLTLFIPEGKTAADMSLDWRDQIERRVRDEWRSMHAYLRWRMQSFLRDHPDVPPPKQAILLVRLYVIPAPESRPHPWAWRLNNVQQIARWRPAADGQRGSMPVEWYDPVVQRFDRLSIDE
jgi:hypothetical protein